MPSSKKPLTTLYIDEVRKSNPAFLNIMENIYREQAARIFQRQYRLTHQTTKPKKYNETLNGKLTMGFLQESISDKYLEYADLIKKNNWLKLDYSDSEFERNIYKALRKNQIHIDDMVTAQLLYHAKDLFKEPDGSFALKQHRYEEKGPYHPTQVSYATDKQIQHFYKNLKNIPTHQQCYFSVNFSKFYEYIFLYEGLSRSDCFAQTRFIDFIKKYFAKMQLSKEERHKIADEIEDLSIPGADYYASQDLRQKLVKLNPERHEYYKNISETKHSRHEIELKASPRFLIALLATESQNPDVAISPDYDNNNPDSPLLCRIIPSIGSFKVLQTAIHEIDTAAPYFIAGQIYPSFMRQIEDKYQARAIELTHPDLIRNMRPHGLPVHSFELTMHDLFHCWRNSALFIKPYIRYVRDILSTTGYYMSKRLWELTDMDYSAGSLSRIALKHYGEWDESLRWHMHIINFTYQKKTYQGIANNDLNLLIILDMVRRPLQWQTFLNITPEKYFLSQRNNELVHDFKLIFQFFAQLDKQFSLKNNLNTTLFAVLAFRLRQLDDDMISKLYQSDLQKYFYWDRNDGVFIKKIFQIEGERCIRKLSPDALLTFCKAEVKPRLEPAPERLPQTDNKEGNRKSCDSLPHSFFNFPKTLVLATAATALAVAGYIAVTKKPGI